MARIFDGDAMAHHDFSFFIVNGHCPFISHLDKSFCQIWISPDLFEHKEEPYVVCFARLRDIPRIFKECIYIYYVRIRADPARLVQFKRRV